MATSMRKENAKGNTGMDHGIQTQDKSYNNYREEEGVINKLNVHKKTYLKKMMVLEGEQMKNANCAKLAAHGRRKAKFAEGNEVKYISDVYSESIHYLNVHRMKFFLSQMTEQLILAEKKVNTRFTS